MRRKEDAMTGAMSGFEKAVVAAARTPGSLAEQLLDDARSHGGAGLLARSGTTLRLMKELAECLLAAELSHHLLRQEGLASAQFGNYRNGSTPKTVSTPSGKIELDVPRVRYSTFVPRLVPRYQRSIPGFDDNIIVLYARGVGLPELQSQLRGLYDAHAWNELGATVTAQASLYTGQWQARRLDRSCELIYFDALQARMHAQGQDTETPMLFALAMRADGRKDVLGFWIDNATDAGFWYGVLCELRERGLLFPANIAADCLPGLQDAAALVYPAARFSFVK
jgi:putative transposase